MSGLAMTKVERIQVRVTAETKDFIERAVAASGSDLTTFVVSAARERAQRVLDEHETMRINAENRSRFYDILTNSPEPSAALKSIFEPSHFTLVD